jgi:hypothetical protein
MREYIIRVAGKFTVGADICNGYREVWITPEGENTRHILYDLAPEKIRHHCALMAVLADVSDQQLMAYIRTCTLALSLGGRVLSWADDDRLPPG